MRAIVAATGNRPPLAVFSPPSARASRLDRFAWVMSEVARLPVERLDPGPTACHALTVARWPIEVQADLFGAAATCMAVGRGSHRHRHPGPGGCLVDGRTS